MNEERGISLIETLLVVVILGVIVILMANLPNALGLISKSSHLGLVREIATKQIEDKRVLTYANLVNGSNSITDFRLGELSSGSGTVLVEDCPVQICTNAEHIKQITVIVNWKEGSKDQTISLQTFIGEGGLD